MSDLDLDAIIARADRYKALFDDLVERRRGLVRRVRELQAEVERLKANQPDGGEWHWQYGRAFGGNVFWPRVLSTDPSGDTHRRRVWYGPVEPIAEAAE